MDAQGQQPYDEEITLKELILSIQDYAREVLKHWKLIALISLPFVGYQLYKVFTTPPKYVGKLTFMIDEEGNSSGASSVLGQFGIATGTQYNLDKVLEISKSRAVLQLVLFSKAEVAGQKDYIANHIIHYSDLEENWAEDTTRLNGFKFEHGQVEQFSRLEFNALKKVLRVVKGSEEKPGIYKTSYDESTGIMSLVFEGRAEGLSIAFVDTLFNRLSTFYVEKAVEKAEITYNIISAKSDSLAGELSAAEYKLANYVDRNQNVFSAREGELQRNRLLSDVQRLQMMYGEAVKNRELAEFNLRNKKPFITLLDSPIPPLGEQRPPLIRSLVIGLLLGVFIGITFVLGRKIYRDALNS